MSLAAKPVTVSSKLNVALNGALVFAFTPVIVSTGAVLSHTAVLLSAAAGPVLAPSVAESFATVTTTFLPLSGVTTSA